MSQSKLVSLFPNSIIDRYTYTLEHIFPGQQGVINPEVRGLDAILMDLIELNASDLHIWSHGGDGKGHYRFRFGGDFMGQSDLTKNHCNSLVTEIFQAYANSLGTLLEQTAFDAWGRFFNRILPDGREVRLVVNIGLCYPHGFDLICRVLIK